MNLREKATLIWKTLIVCPALSLSLDKINLEEFNQKQLKDISSVLHNIFTIVFLIIFYKIISIIDKVWQHNYEYESLYIFLLVILVFAILYLKYLIIQAKEDYEKRQSERDNYFTKYKINLDKSAENFSVKEVETMLNSHLYNNSSLCEQLKSRELQSFLDGIYYTLYYLLETKDSHFEWPYSPIIKQRKCHFEENESFVKQIMDYGIKKLKEANYDDSVLSIINSIDMMENKDNIAKCYCISKQDFNKYNDIIKQYKFSLDNDSDFMYSIFSNFMHLKLKEGYVFDVVDRGLKYPYIRRKEEKQNINNDKLWKNFNDFLNKIERDKTIISNAELIIFCFIINKCFFWQPHEGIYNPILILASEEIVAIEKRLNYTEKEKNALHILRIPHNITIYKNETVKLQFLEYDNSGEVLLNEYYISKDNKIEKKSQHIIGVKRLF